MYQDVKRCNVCILPKSGLFDFDDHGTCSLCHVVRQAQGAAEVIDEPELLERYIGEIRARGRGRPFDCVVGVSGGRDSSYLLYLLTRKHQLRCLAAYYRTPFTSDVTDANVRRLTSILEVPLAELPVPQELHRRVAREFTMMWAEKPDPVIANMACAPCKLVNREVFKLARARGIRSVVYGGNRFEAVQIAVGAARDGTMTTSAAAAKQLALKGQLQRGLQLTKKGIEALKASAQLWRYIPLGVQASIMYICPHTAYLRFRYPDIFTLEYFCFGGWSEGESQRILAELGWEMPPACNSMWKSDCSFAEQKNIMLLEMTGVSYMEAFLSNMIRVGALSRDEALRRIAVEGRPSAERIAQACEAMELPAELTARFLQAAQQRTIWG